MMFQQLNNSVSVTRVLHTSNPIHGYVFYIADGFTPAHATMVRGESFGDAYDEYLADEKVEAHIRITDDEIGDYDPDTITYNDNGTPIDTDWVQGFELKVGGYDR